MIEPLHVFQIPRDSRPQIDPEESMEADLTDYYFQVDPAEYFERRMWAIMAAAHLDDTSVDPWRKSDESSLYNQFRVIYGKDADFNTATGGTLDQMTLASVESYALMTHVIETALRFYVAAKERREGRSPVRALLDIRRPKDLREPIDELLTNAGLTAVPGRIFPAHLINAAGGDRDQTMKHVLFMVQWLNFFAAFYSDSKFAGAQGNNQLKHGAIFIPRTDFVCSLITLEANEEVPDAPTAEHLERQVPVINAHSVTYVTRQWIDEKDSEPGFSLRTDNSDPATNLAIAQAGISVVRSLWQISKAVANPFEETDYDFDWSPLPSDVMKRSNRPPRAIQRVLIEPRVPRAEAKQSRGERSE